MTDARTLLITGCSSGIGHHCAHAMKARGWRVVASCRKPGDVARLREEGLDCVLIDYQDEASIEAGFTEALALLDGRIDALFNNGAYGLPGMVEDLPTQGLRDLFEANFFGWHTLSRLALAKMREQGSGRLVQCSSVLGFATLKVRGAYNASKFALEGLTDTLRLELKGSGIEAILIEPGPIDTEIRRNSRAHYERWIAPHRENSVWRDYYKTTLEPRLYGEGGPKDRFELGCDAVQTRLVHALESSRPRARYYVTTPTYVAGFLKRVLSTRGLDWVLSRN